MSFVIVLAISVALVCGLLFSIGRRPRLESPVSRQWVEEFSPAKYQAMERLLRQRDYDFLAGQPGFRPSIAHKLRKERRRIYLAYLRDLTVDFNRLHGVAVRAAALSNVDRERTIEMLARQKLTFQRAVWSLRLRLALNRVGIGTVNATPAIDALRELSVAAQRLSEFS